MADRHRVEFREDGQSLRWKEAARLWRMFNLAKHPLRGGQDAIARATRVEADRILNQRLLHLRSYGAGDGVYCDPVEAAAAEMAAHTIHEISGYAMAYGNVCDTRRRGKRGVSDGICRR